MNSSRERLGEPKRSAALPGRHSDSCRWPDYKPWDPNSPMDRSLEHSNRGKDSMDRKRSTDNIHRHKDSHIPKATQS